MNLKDVLKDIDCVIYGNENVEIENLTHNSKEENKNGLFFAINGNNFNGEDYAFEAIGNGAKVIVSENKLAKEIETNVVVKDIRKAMSLIARNYYNNPAEKMLLIGVTGTNGKTTTTYMLKSIFEKAGKKVGVIGTNGVVINNQKVLTDFTTPDPILLQKILREMVEKNVEVVCMEVSAHALELQKLWGVMTDIALFTNLTLDHLDYFKTMDNYFEAKRKFFTPDYARFGVVNIDDPYGKIIYNSSEIPLISYSKLQENIKNSDISASDIKLLTKDQEFIVKTMKGEFKVKLNMLGNFNVSNALGAIAAAIMAGVNKKHIISALNSLEQVDGRFNSFWHNGARIIVDYAHTPDGLENILKAAKEFTQNKLISVFGCGGNRDTSKRHVMGEISSRLADLTIITTDNPRNEDPMDIIEGIERGVVNNNYILEIDRVTAIKKALNLTKYGDTVVITGKGAENYFDINNEKVPYQTDAKIVEEVSNEVTKRIQRESILL